MKPITSPIAWTAALGLLVLSLASGPVGCGVPSSQVRTTPNTGYVVFKATIAIALWGGTAIGYWLMPLNWIERLWAFVAAAFLVIAAPATDEIGLGMAAAFFAWVFLQSRRGGGMAAA